MTASIDEILFSTEKGLSEKVVREISSHKNEPTWMLEHRLRGLRAYNRMATPTWGVDLSGLDLSQITFYRDVVGREKKGKSWEDVPDDIRQTYEKLGIPEAEAKFLSGAGAQFEGEIVYNNLKREWEDKGVIFMDIDSALHEHPKLFKKHFMTDIVPIEDNKYTALHAAVWSGGSFLYVPKGVKVAEPVQAYFLMQFAQGGQFEHTLIIAEEDSEVQYIEGCSAPKFNEISLHSGLVEIFVKSGARVRYSTVQNWPKDTYNLNTKRAVVEANGTMEWVSGSLGSYKTMLYPASILIGEGARAEHLSISFAGENQHLDSGAKVIMNASNTSCLVMAKSLCKDGGVATYRGLIKVTEGATGCKAKVDCDSLLLDDRSVTETIPVIQINESDVNIAHEAKVGQISDEALFYMQTRGIPEAEASKLIVLGFMNPILKELPLEYAVELNRLIEMEMDESVG